MFDFTTHPGRVGLRLVTTGAAIIAATVWLLPITDGDRGLAMTVAAVMAGVALTWHTVERTRSRPLDLVVYPLITFAGLGTIGALTTDVATTYGGLLTMAFIYTGLFAPPRSTWPLILPATSSWLLANGLLSNAPLPSLEVRLPMTITIWACIGGLLSQHAQLTSRRAASLRREARRDPLTGLRNRRELEEILAGSTHGDALILIDIDRFKSINDRGGHAAGDQLLVDFARVLSRSVRDQDLTVRFGGDEFLVYLPGTSVDSAEAVLARVHETWAEQDRETTFSAGLAPVRTGRDGSDAFVEADRYLYQAKAAGRDRWVRPTVLAIPSARTGETPVGEPPAQWVEQYVTLQRAK